MILWVDVIKWRSTAWERRHEELRRARSTVLEQQLALECSLRDFRSQGETASAARSSIQQTLDLLRPQLDELDSIIGAVGSFADDITGVEAVVANTFVAADQALVSLDARGRAIPSQRGLEFSGVTRQMVLHVEFLARRAVELATRADIAFASRLGVSLPGWSPIHPLKPEFIATLMEQRLRSEGLLDGVPGDLYLEWLLNAARRGVSVEEIIAIARDHDIRPDDFDALKDLERFIDPDGKSFFLLPTDISSDSARKVVLMTYIFNAGTDYDTADDPGNIHNTGNSVNDYLETSYSSKEIQRIIDRMAENSWSYTMDVAFVHSNEGQMVSTPNGMLMGVGGNWLIDKYSLSGGTTWGDIFMVNIDDSVDPGDTLERIVTNGSSPGTTDANADAYSFTDLDRLLHHEEVHSQQWADEGYLGFGASYIWEAITTAGDGAKNKWEIDAGLFDGGYR